MYLEHIKFIDVGPIREIDLKCRFSVDGHPTPLIVVGTNGSGKSIFLSHIVNALLISQNEIFDDADVEAGKVYKLRGPSNIRRGKSYALSELNFSKGIQFLELQLSTTKSDFNGVVPAYAKWNEVHLAEHSHFHCNVQENKEAVEKDLNHSTHLYFPANRFEQPVWINEKNLKSKASYFRKETLQRHSNRPLIHHSPMAQIQDWLLDLLYDSHTLDVQSHNVDGKKLLFRDGTATQILVAIESILRTLFGLGEQNITWDIGKRSQRRIGITINGNVVVPNLFELSTGQAIILDMFLTLIRDFDLSRAEMTSLSDISGIAVIDEVDMHLHADLQHDLLPKLFRLFPHVQFILTSHSPLFLLGMENAYGKDGFQLVELPSGREIEVGRFSEFEVAYKHMANSTRFHAQVREALEDAQKPIVYLEGTTDIDYIIAAAEHLDKTDLLKGFELVDAKGYRNLDKIWNGYQSLLGSSIPQRCILLYDCDAQKPADSTHKLFRRTIPQKEHKVRSGIENLFSNETLQKARNSKAAFIDVVAEHTIVTRGTETLMPEKWDVNADEKRNLCDWLRKNGDADDFSEFSEIFSILKEVIEYQMDE